MFYHISYISRAAIPGDKLEEELRNIAVKSSHKNRKANIFGCLIYRSGWFLQYLEGEKQTVNQLYELVKHDPRHLEVQTLSCGYQAENLYSQWSSMQVLSDPAETEIALDIIKDIPRQKISPCTPNKVSTLPLLQLLSAAQKEPGKCNSNG